MAGNPNDRVTSGRRSALRPPWECRSNQSRIILDAMRQSDFLMVDVGLIQGLAK